MTVRARPPVYLGGLGQKQMKSACCVENKLGVTVSPCSTAVENALFHAYCMSMYIACQFVYPLHFVCLMLFTNLHFSSPYLTLMYHDVRM